MRADRFLLAACCLLPLPPAASAQEQPPGELPPGMTPEKMEILSRINWVEGPTEARLGSVATLAVPEGHIFIDGGDANALAQMNGNPRNDQSLGMLFPDDESWQVTFSYSPDGYVSEDEADDLDADAILESLTAGNDQANEYRRSHGGVVVDVVGWDTKPYYNAQAKQLIWAVRARSMGQDSINYNTRVLGRGGVLSANLVAAPEDLVEAKQEWSGVMSGMAFNAGQRHADFKEGDKLAEYGLTGLIVGGGLALAAKTGLLGKLLKPLLIGGAILLASLGKFWKKLTGQEG